MTDSKLTPVKEAVGISINVTFPTADPQKNGVKNMVIQTYYPQDGDVQGQLKELFSEVDYHTARYEIDSLKDALRNLNTQREDQVAHLQEFRNNDVQAYKDSNRKGEYRMSHQTAQQVNKMLNLISRMKTQMEYFEGEIALKEKFIKDHDSRPKSKKVA